MGNCVGTIKPDIRRSDALKFRSLVHEKQYYMLKLIYTDLSSRISQNELNLQNFLLFFQKNGCWGDRLFKQFDVGSSNLITEEQFIKGIIKIFKTSENKKIQLLFKFFSGNIQKNIGIGFSEFLTMLYNYPKQDFKAILNNEQFFNRELRKNLIADSSAFKGRRLDSISMKQLTVSGTTFRVDQNYSESTCIDNKVESEVLNEIYKRNNLKSTRITIKVANNELSVATSNIHRLVKKFAISIFKNYNINIKHGKLQFQQFRDWMLRHKQLYNNYYKGFHSQIWQFDQINSTPLFVSAEVEFSSQAHIFPTPAEKKVIICLIHSILIVRDQLNSKTPLLIVCLDGLLAKKIFQQGRGFGIEITHRDQIYVPKKFYVKNEQLADQWMEYLKFYKGCSISMSYDLGQKIGIGKFSIVYDGKDNQTGQQYAIKVIQSSKLDEDAKKLIAHESTIMSIVSHPLLISYKESIQTKTHMYIITELINGKDLYEYVKERPSRFLSQLEAMFIIKQIIIGVRYLHSLGIVHRDLKPENIMIQCLSKKKIGKIKIIDFGFANYLKNIDNFTPEERLAGTPNYIAPESLRLEDKISQKIDNFAIGSILYFMLSGKLAFDGCSVKEILQNTIQGIYYINCKKWKSISQQAKDLTIKLLQNDPKDRITLEQALDHPWFTKFPTISQIQTT